MLLLWPVGLIARALELEAGGKAMGFLICLWPILCDLGLAALIGAVARRRFGEQRALRFAAFAAFCPALLYDTAVWKQVDGVFCLLLVAAFLLLEEKKWLPAAALYGFALAVKPQALLFGPVLAVAFLAPLLAARQRRPALTALWPGRGGGRAGAGGGAGLRAALLGQPGRRLAVGEIHLHRLQLPLRQRQRLQSAHPLRGQLAAPGRARFAPVTWQMLGAAGIVSPRRPLSVSPGAAGRPGAFRRCCWPPSTGWRCSP